MISFLSHRSFAIGILAIGFLFSCKENNSFPSIGIGGDFSLPRQDGTFSLQDYRGETFLLFFGYTQCPDICPMTMSKISGSLKILKDNQISPLPRVIFVSVDSKRDNPKSVQEYIRYFDEKAIGLTGSKQEIDKVVTLFGASYTVTPSTSKLGDLIDHSTYIYLIDGTGTVRYLFRQADTKESIADVLKVFISLSSER